MAQSLLEGGLADWIDADNVTNQPPSITAPPAPAESSGNITIRNNSSSTGNIMSTVIIYEGYEARGEPYAIYSEPVLGGQQVSWNLPEGVYTFETFLNNRSESFGSGLTGGGKATVGITSDSVYIANFSDGYLGSFSKR